MNNQSGHAASMQVLEKIGGQGRNRTIDTRIFSYHSGNEVTPRSERRNDQRECYLFASTGEVIALGFASFPAGFATPVTSTLTAIPGQAHADEATAAR